MRLICRSRTYQLVARDEPWNEDDKLNYSHAMARRLPAEVLYDAIYRVTGLGHADSRRAARHAGGGIARCRRQPAGRLPDQPGPAGAGERLRMRADAAACSWVR